MVLNKKYAVIIAGIVVAVIAISAISYASMDSEIDVVETGISQDSEDSQTESDTGKEFTLSLKDGISTADKP